MANQALSPGDVAEQNTQEIRPGAAHLPTDGKTAIEDNVQENKPAPVEPVVASSGVSTDTRPSSTNQKEDKKIGDKDSSKTKAVGGVKKKPKPPLISPTATLVQTASASFADPGEGLASSAEPTEPVLVIPGPTDPLPSSPPTPPPRVIDMDDARAPSQDADSSVAKEQQQIEQVTSVESPSENPPQQATSPGVAQPPVVVGSPSDGGVDVGKIEIGVNVPFVSLPASSSPPGNKETAFWRLSNKVKVIRLSLSLLFWRV